METSVITLELTRIRDKVNEIRLRSHTISLANGMRNGVWAWCFTLVLFGTLVLLFPVPGIVRASLVIVQAIVILWVVWRAMIGPILFRWGKKQWALYCEELHPQLDKRLVRCLDIAEGSDGHIIFRDSPVASMLLKETSAEIARFDPGAVLPAKRVMYHIGLLFIPLSLLGISFLAVPGYVTGLFTALYNVDMPVTSLWAMREASKAGVEEIILEPGDREVARGANVEFSASIVRRGDGDLEVIPQLHIETEADETSVQDMLAGESPDSSFKLAMIDVQTPFVYHATVAGISTPEYRVSYMTHPRSMKLGPTSRRPPTRMVRLKN